MVHIKKKIRFSFAGRSWEAVAVYDKEGMFLDIDKVYPEGSETTRKGWPNMLAAPKDVCEVYTLDGLSLHEAAAMHAKEQEEINQ